MRKFVVITILLFLANTIHAQPNVQFELGASGTFAALGKYDPKKATPIDTTQKKVRSDYGYVGFNAFVGSILQFKNTSFLFQLQYQRTVSGQYYLIEKERLRKSHLIGVNLGFRFLEKSRFKPFIQIKALSEVQSNYVNKSIISFGPTNSDAPLFHHYQMHIFPFVEIFQITLYQSTPFIGELVGGVAIRLVDNLHLNFAIGYNLSILNYKYARFQYDVHVKEDYQEKLRNSPMRHVFLHSLSAQLGLSYAFDVSKKKTKTL